MGLRLLGDEAHIEATPPTYEGGSGMRFRGVFAGSVRILMVAIVLGVALHGYAAGADPYQRVPVEFVVNLTCLPGGGASIAVTIGNHGRIALRIRDDFRVSLSSVYAEGSAFVSVVYVLPELQQSTIEPGGSQTFTVLMGDAEPLETAGDLNASARQLVVEAKVFFEGLHEAVRGLFPFSGVWCAAIEAGTSVGGGDPMHSLIIPIEPAWRGASPGSRPCRRLPATSPP